MKIEQISETKIIYQRRIGAYGIENKNLMTHFKAWLKTHQLLKDDAVVLALAWDNPVTTTPQNCRYDVALTVDNFDTFEQLDASSIKAGHLKASRYAIFTIAHTVEAIQQTMQNMFADLAQAGYTFNPQQPIIERYAMKMLKNDLCEICVPIL